MNCSRRCKYYTGEFIEWCFNNKMIVFLGLLSFSLFVSTLVLSSQKKQLQNELRSTTHTTPKEEITTSETTPDETTTEETTTYETTTDETTTNETTTYETTTDETTTNATTPYQETNDTNSTTETRRINRKIRLWSE